MRMLVLLPLLFLGACQEADVYGLFESYMWQKRVVVLLAPSDDHSDYVQMKHWFANETEGLKERDVVRWGVIDGEHVKVNDAKQAHLGTPPFYDYFNVTPDKFTVIVIGKDGTDKLRTHKAVTAEKLFSLIDAMPMRQSEMKQTQ